MDATAQLPVAEYLKTLPHGTAFAAAYLTDEAGNPFLLRSVYDPDVWQFAGGNLDFGDDLWGCARRETEEETGLVLPRNRAPCSPSRSFRRPASGRSSWASSSTADS